MRNGGLMVLHKLAYELANKGHNVYVFTNPYYPHPNIKVIPSIRKNPKWLSNNAEHYSFSLPDLPDENTISIYTEIQKGNPYNIKYVTRWILYNTNYSIENTWLDTDIYFNYGIFSSNKPTIGQLKATDYNFDKLYNTDNQRSGFCYILHKNTPTNGEQYIKEVFNATNLTGWQNQGYDYLREELNKYEYLLLFDHKTFNALTALLCGTKVINLSPNPPIPPEQYRKENLLRKFGLAQGLSDITHANNTIHLARPHIESLAKGDNKTIEDFIEFWQEKIK
tara:strand:- start:46 stop:885 length:840 start_codon:yes stop_codon:yes gene_type:complete